MRRERLVKDYDNLGLRCAWAVQYYDPIKKVWFWKETYNAKGFNKYMPKWYNTENEAKQSLDPKAKLSKTVIFGETNDIGKL